MLAGQRCAGGCGGVLQDASSAAVEKWHTELTTTTEMNKMALGWLGFRV